MTRSIYLLGGPGSGKSTLMYHLLLGWAAGPYVRFTTREMFGHHLLSDDLEVGIYLGHLRPEYPGTDALSLSVAPQALIWLESLQPEVACVFGEGARLGHLDFLSALAAKTDLTVGHLVVDPQTAHRRRIHRAGKLLSEQYCKSATSRAASTAAACRAEGIQVVDLDGTLAPTELVHEMG